MLLSAFVQRRPTRDIDLLAKDDFQVVARGDTTTRDRDFADVLLLAGRHDIDAANLSDAIAATAAFRRVEMRPIGEALVTLGRDRHRGHPSGHGLRRSRHHRLGDIWPLRPSASSMDGLALRAVQHAWLLVVCSFAVILVASSDLSPGRRWPMAFMATVTALRLDGCGTG